MILPELENVGEVLEERSAPAPFFHSSTELRSTIAVSCDICHPDASNTHPEKYPKFRQQVGKTVLLRDMVNWLIEHPVRGTKLDTDSEELRALEAYILAQRGTPSPMASTES